LKKRWEVWTKWKGGGTKRHYCGSTEASAKRVFTIWTEDMDQALTVQLLCEGELAGEYSKGAASVIWTK